MGIQRWRGWHSSLWGHGVQGGVVVLALGLCGGLAACGSAASSTGGATALTGPTTNCGQVHVAGPGLQNPTQAQQNANCFYQAYQHCSAATLEASFMGIDTGADHKLVTIASGNGCAVQDTMTRYQVPSAATPTPQVYTCTSVKQTATALVLDNCGDLGTVSIPVTGGGAIQGG